MCKHYQDFRHQVPMKIGSRMRSIDRCMVPLMAMFKSAGIMTLGHCCGHGIRPGYIIYEDPNTGKEAFMMITDRETHMLLDRFFPNNTAGEVHKGYNPALDDMRD